MNGAKTIIKKELTRVFKDKKLVFSLFILPAILMIGMYSLMGTMMEKMVDNVEQHASNVYIQNAPDGLKEVMEASLYSNTANITYISESDSVETIQESILKGEVDLLVSFPSTFLEEIKAYKVQGDTIPNVSIYYNTAEDYSVAAYNSFKEKVLSPLETNLLGERLGNLEQLTVFKLNEKIIVDADKENGKVLAMLIPYLITFLLFVGAMSLGVDAITGEKERGTMAKLLLAPIKRSEIVYGKLISLVILSSISACVYAVSMIFGMPLMAGDLFGEGTSATISFSVLEAIQLLIIMLVMVYVYVGLVALVSVIAKTAKEANTYISPIYIVVIVAGLLTMYQGGFEKPLYMYAIPVYGNSLAIQNLMTKELTLVQFGVSIAGTLALAAIVTALLTKAFKSEKIMFNA